MARAWDRRALVDAAPGLWSLLLALLLLGPALAPGFVLTYDMVWVPDLGLGVDALGVGSGLPRAVPSDAVVAVLDDVIPGMLLQKLVLVATLTAAGAGAAALVGGLPLLARCAAATVYVWNPFVVERLVIGHWPVLVGYAVLPWLILEAGRWRRESSVRPHLLLLLPLGCLSASAGIASGLAVLLFGLGRGRLRNALLTLVVLAGNAPWLVAGLLHAGRATSDPAGAVRFATNGEGPLPGPLAALGLGGIWNREVVPVSREGALAVLALAALLLVAGAGLRAWWRGTDRRDAIALAVCWGVGWGVAVLSWGAPQALGWLAAEVPGGGLLRDGSRLLVLSAPLLGVLSGHGVARIRAWFQPHASATVVASLAAVLPLAMLPDAAWGASGRLHAARYPDWYDATRTAVDPSRGEVLLLPFTSYRAPAWNRGQKVLDPLGRYLGIDHVSSDELVVSGQRLAGEDPRGEAVRQALTEPTPGARASALTDLGIGTLVVERAAPGESPEVAGESILTSSDVRVVTLGEARERPVPDEWWLAMSVAWAAFLSLLVTGVTWTLVRRRRDM
ncbi:hypothetical protein [Nocardioides donggukensis]|uniref:Uncharacterized protein n=1 Tax=Nocardioides donggukensis TaxID=2774019 RepID=A0A927Q150_9ACTN|nr:hypothetical protein [Nocardioides donggukensis]MBD8869687.1 hypothetical protein [Nocardioides donggukensis]